MPGHGPIGTAADIAPVRQYLADVGRLALDAVRSGASADGAAATPIPAPYSDWGGREVFAHNLRFLYQRAAQFQR